MEIPTPPAASIVAAAGLSYGWLDPAADLDQSGQRLGATLGAAIAPLPFLSLAADVRGHLDVFSRSAGGSEINLYGEPRLSARFTRSLTERLAWGAEADVRLVGAQAPSVYWPATSGSLRGLLGMQLAPQTWLAAQLGFHLDRSAAVVPEPARVSATDRRTLGMSSWNAVQWGLGVSHRLASGRTELIAELSGEALVGATAPGLLRSPWQLGLGARQPLGAALSVSFDAELGLSAPQRAAPLEDLRPIPARLTAGFNVLWRVGLPAPLVPSVPAERPRERPEPEPEPAPVAIAPVAPSAVSGVVVDEGGRPLPDALISLAREGADDAAARSADDGSFTFPDVAAGALELHVSAPGFDAAQVAIAPGEERTREIVLHPSVPAGQVRGRVLDLAGAPLAASVTINPGEHRVQVQPDGSFTLELAPGRYSVKLEHPSFLTQERAIVIRDRAVVILNIALSRP